MTPSPDPRDAAGEPDTSTASEGDGSTPETDGGATASLTGVFTSLSARDALGIYLKGALMGAADTVPGVSGGTIALVTGIYERLIAAITAFDPRDLRHFLGIHRPSGRAGVVDTLDRIDAPFLAALGAGVVTSVVTIARVVEVLAAEYPGALSAFFFGLIAASAVVLYGEVDLTTPGRVAVAVAGIAIAVLVTGATGTQASHALPVLFVAGAVAICAMVLPGVSGAFLLLILGQYEYMLGVLNDFTGALAGLVGGGDTSALSSAGSQVVVFLSGAVVGLLTIAHAINWALEHYRAATLTFLVSLMVGGLRLPAENVLATDPTAADLPLLVGAGLVGAVGVVAFDYFTDDLDYGRPSR